MTSTEARHVSCYHLGPDFDWWRCNEEGYVGRPPSPFPASFEHARMYRDDSADVTYGRRGCGDGVGQANPANDCDEATRRLYWPLCQGPELVIPTSPDPGAADTSGQKKGALKSPRRSHKRPPWVPAKMPNKWGVAGHPPPYTNYCKETMFNTRTADPSKVTIKTTF
ncbi:uncharacterized protein LOC131951845 [Physella acuta]|uniref:uncharacterized protein LOC131951845 n=1 Tax=Physella acuta TaxID=109671 RepID=UPI0027DE0CD0|nr:uncharacterized protein LOC131951845 [Physella acuta]